MVTRSVGTTTQVVVTGRLDAACSRRLATALTVLRPHVADADVLDALDSSLAGGDGKPEALR